MTNPMLNDLAARRRLTTEEGDIILEGESPAELDRVRRLAAQEGREILLKTDATQAQIEAIVADPGLDEISARMREAGAILQPLPASYNPSEVLRDQVDLWVDPEDRLIYLGLTADAKIGDVVVAAARVLAQMLNIDTGRETATPLTGVVTEALLRSFSLRLAARFGHEETVALQLHSLMARLQQAAHKGRLPKQEATESGILLWAILTAVPENERSFVRGHVQRFAPHTSWVAQRIEARIGEQLPETMETAARARRIIEAVLAAPELAQERPEHRKGIVSPSPEREGKKPAS